MDEKLVEKCAEAIYAEANKQTTYVGDYRFPDGEGTTTCLDGDFDLAGFARAVFDCIEENGMVVVPKLADNELETWARVLPHPQSGNSDLRYLHSLAVMRSLSSSPKG